MIHSIIIRDYQQHQTPGKLLVYNGLDFLYICSTLELPFLDNKKNISCIPNGTYLVNKVATAKRGRYFVILNVPGRSGIRIHAGNYASGTKVDTLGCICPGRSFSDLNSDGYLDIYDSRQVLSELCSLLPDDFILTII